MNEAKGAFAIFSQPEAVLAAAEKATGRGYEFETFTPFPIHGMEDAMRLKPSVVPWATLIGGLTGFASALALQIWTSAINWPINVGGKPLISLPAFIPVTFELTVLFGGLSTAFFMFFLNGLPSQKPVLDPRITDDRFALYIPFSKQKESASQIESFLRGLNAEKVSVVHEEPV